MADQLNLEPLFYDKIKKLINVMGEKHHIKVHPYCGTRSLYEQMKLYGKGRTKNALKQISFLFGHSGMGYLELISSLMVELIEKDEVEESEKIVTNALPGFSFHNWGLAVDCYIEDPTTGKPLWDLDESVSKGVKADDLYKIYADTAFEMGITPGYYFKSFKDALHLQKLKDLETMFSYLKDEDFKDESLSEFKNIRLKDISRLSNYK